MLLIQGSPAGAMMMMAPQAEQARLGTLPWTRSMMRTPRAQQGRANLWCRRTIAHQNKNAQPEKKRLRHATGCSIYRAGRQPLGKSEHPRYLEVPTNQYFTLPSSAVRQNSDIRASGQRVTTALRARAGRLEPDLIMQASCGEEAGQALAIAEETYPEMRTAQRRIATDSRFFAAGPSAALDMMAGSPFGTNKRDFVTLKESDRSAGNIGMDPAMAALSRLEHTLAEDRASGPSNSQRPRVPRVTREPFLTRRFRRFTSQLFARKAS